MNNNNSIFYLSKKVMIRRLAPYNKSFKLLLESRELCYDHKVVDVSFRQPIGCLLARVPGLRPFVLAIWKSFKFLAAPNINFTHIVFLKLFLLSLKSRYLSCPITD